MSKQTHWILQYGRDSARVIEQSLEKTAGTLEQVVRAICDSLQNDRKTVFFGNGGSAADAQHLAAEFVNRYLLDRPELAGMALTTDTSVITSIANDFGYDQLFAKQVRALCRPGDVAIGLSTSGTSKNVLAGLDAAKAIGCITVGMCGKNTEPMIDSCDYVLSAQSDHTPLIQQVHITLGHALCYLVEQQLFGSE